MTQLRITGKPVFSCPLVGLPSVNTHYNTHWRKRSVMTGEWRTWAKDEAGIFMWENPDLPRPIVNRALIVVNVFPPHEEISDIHNVHIKAILDGFTDAGLWVDDEWAFVPLVLYAFAGIGTQKPGTQKQRITVIDVYELEAYIKNGDRQRLPKGRTWF